MENTFCLFLFVLCFRRIDVIHAKDGCRSCLPIEQCHVLRDMSKAERTRWMEQNPCDQIPAASTRSYDGFSDTAKGDSVCCPDSNVWKIEDDNGIANSKSPDGYKPVKIEYKILDNIQNNIDTYRSHYVTNEEHILKKHKNRNIFKRQISRQTPPMQPQNPFFQIRPILPRVEITNNGNGNTRVNMEQQCSVQTSLPPDPETGCCGRDTSEADRITDIVNFMSATTSTTTSTTNAPRTTVNWQQYFLPRGKRQVIQPRIPTRPVNNTNIGGSFQSWIAGGNETELEQFPWTVLLEVLFNYGDRMVAYTCGGSLISSRYILTAAHCVSEPGAQISGIEITLSEYDKRTFPNDCITTQQGQRCVQNVVIPAEAVIVHPQYDNNRLNNDIALIRLRGPAPYTRFIRPICLTPVDLDMPNLQNLPLSVAGWGQNMQSSTNVKQSTVLNLVPFDQCRQSYPELSRSHICAAGASGEDTCKGDSGGPLMVLFRGSYYVMGVVSGKRADSPCGTAVPSLFTNVFNYLNWIRSVVRS